MGERLRTLQARFGLRPTPLVFGIAFLALGVAGLGGGADGETAWLWVVLLTVGADLIYLYADDGVAHACHLGGAAAGLLLAFALCLAGAVKGTHDEPTLDQLGGLSEMPANPRPAITEIPSVNPMTRPFSTIAKLAGSRPANCAAINWTPTAASARPTAAPATTMSELSVISCRTIRPRPAPSTVRNAISRPRSCPRASA